MTSVYADYANLTSSEKIVLCHIEPKQQIKVFEFVSNNVYRRLMNYFVIGVSEDTTTLTQGVSATLSSGQWYYDALTGYLYVRTSDDSDPKTLTLVVTYRLFYSNRPINLPYNLTTGSEVYYDGRLKSNSPINKDLDENQIGVVLESSTTLSFENTDGHFDSFYDKLIFENKTIKIWSWSNTLPISEKKLLFTGYITDKSFSFNDVKFKCKDDIYSLRLPIQMESFTINDGTISDTYLYKPKRLIFGEVKQLSCTPVDAILDGFILDGIVSGTNGTTSITGSGTFFVSACTAGDTILVQTGDILREINIASVNSNTSLTTSSELDFSFSTTEAKLSPATPFRFKNRNWHIAGHKLRAPSTTVTLGTQPNRFEVDDITDFRDNDLIEVNGESAFIKRISGNKITLKSNLQSGTPSIGNTVIKVPVNKVFFNGRELIYGRDYSLSNSSTDAILNIENDAEVNITTAIPVGYDLTFTNGSNAIVLVGTNLQAEIQPRDWIRSDDVTHTTWYEILSVDYDNDTNTSSVRLRTNYAGTTTTGSWEKKNVVYIQDDSIITVNCLGLENEDGEWVKTASDAVKYLLEYQLGTSNLNTASFTEADNDFPHSISYFTPEKIGGNNKTIRDVVTAINQSVFGSLVLDENFNFKYNIILPERPTLSDIVYQDDILSVTSINSNNSIVGQVNAFYRPFTDALTGEEASDFYQFRNEFATNLVGSLTEVDLKLYLFSDDAAQEIAQRYALYNSLSQSMISFRAKLNFALKSLNDVIFLKIDRIYKRFGGNNQAKIGIINKISQDGSDVDVVINDLGNTFNRVGCICADDSSDFTGATDDEKMVNSYICDDDVLVPDTSSDDELWSNIIG